MKCQDCGFLANDDLSLEVHSARTYCGRFECALCGFAEKDEDNLNIHLKTFTSSLCIPRILVKNVPEVTTHLFTKHTKNSINITIIHIKMDRKDPEVVTMR